MSTSTSNQIGVYILRSIVIGIALVALPALPFIFIDFVPEQYRWPYILWLPVALWLWARLARRLLVKGRYTCPKCGQKVAEVEVVERGDVGDVYLVCPACGFREKSDDVMCG